MKIQLILLVYLTFTLNSCKVDVNDNFQNSDIGRYLKEIHNLELINEKQVIIFIPASTCGFCKNELLDLLSKQKLISKKMYIVIAGFNNAELIPQKILLKRIQKKILLDIGYQYKHYISLRSNYPFYVYLNEEQEIKQFEINGNTSKNIL